jgi:hypothetical protein
VIIAIAEGGGGEKGEGEGGRRRKIELPFLHRLQK